MAPDEQEDLSKLWKIIKRDFINSFYFHKTIVPDIEDGESVSVQRTFDDWMFQKHSLAYKALKEIGQKMKFHPKAPEKEIFEAPTKPDGSIDFNAIKVEVHKMWNETRAYTLELQKQCERICWNTY